MATLKKTAQIHYPVIVLDFLTARLEMYNAIANCGFKKNILATFIGLNYPQFYRRFKAYKFSDNELVSLFSYIYPSKK